MKSSVTVSGENVNMLFILSKLKIIQIFQISRRVQNIHLLDNTGKNFWTNLQSVKYAKSCNTINMCHDPVLRSNFGRTSNSAYLDKFLNRLVNILQPIMSVHISYVDVSCENVTLLKYCLNKLLVIHVYAWNWSFYKHKQQNLNPEIGWKYSSETKVEITTCFQYKN